MTIMRKLMQNFRIYDGRGSQYMDCTRTPDGHRDGMLEELRRADRLLPSVIVDF